MSRVTNAGPEAPKAAAHGGLVREATPLSQRLPQTFQFSGGLKYLSLPLWMMILFLVFAGVAFVLHHRGFSAPLLYDSTFLTDNSHAFFRHDPLAVIRILPERPLIMLSFYVNFLVTGLDPYYFRVVNCFILAGAGVALVLLNVVLTEAPGIRIAGTRSDRLGVSLFLGFLFVAHPLQSLVILYVWQRAAIAACLFYVSGLALYLALRFGLLRRAIATYALISAFLAGGILCKENLITLPGILFLSELVFIRQGTRQLLKRGLILVLITLPGLVLYFLVVHGLHQPTSLEPQGILNRLQDHYMRSGFTPAEVALTECRVLFSYLRMILIPLPDGVDLIRAVFISKSLWNPPATAAACAGLIAMLGLGMALTRTQPVTGFGILFFIISLAPELFLSPQYLFFGHRAVLPMAGVLIVVGQAALALEARIRPVVPERLFLPVTLGACLVPVTAYAGVTLWQATNWHPLSFWKRHYVNLPESPANVQKLSYLHILVNYGGELVKAGRYDEAIAAFNRALKIKSDSHEIFANLGNAKLGQGRPDEAADYYGKALELNPDSDRAHLQLGKALLGLGKDSGAMDHYRRALSLNPNLAEAHSMMGYVFTRQGRVSQAWDSYRRALEIDPFLVDAHNQIGNILLSRGKPLEASEHYRKAVKARPDSAESHNNLGAALARLNRVNEAKECFQRAVEIHPDSAKAHANLGTTLLTLGDLPQAVEHLTRAITLDAGLVQARVHLGHALWASGDIPKASRHYSKAASIAPDSEEAHYHLARALFAMGDMHAAIDQYRTVLKLNPRNHVAHNALGSALMASGELAEAADHFRRALELRPDMVEAKQNLDQAIRALDPEEKRR